MKRVLSRLIALVTLGFIIFIIIKNFSFVKKGFIDHPWYFIVIAGLYIAGRFFDGLKLYVLVRYFDLKMSLAETFGISMVVPLYNLIFPYAGIVTNALYLKSKHKLAFKNFISLSLSRNIVAVGTCATIGIIGCILYMISHNHAPLSIVIVFYTCALVFSIGVFFLPDLPFKKNSNIVQKINDTVVGFKQLRSNRKIFRLLLLCQAFVNITFLLRYFVVFKALSLSISFIAVCAVVPLTELSNLINLIPANLGIREAVMSVSTALIGFSLKQGLLVASIDRLVLLSVTILGGGWHFIKLRYHSNLLNNNETMEKVRFDE